jgi:polygalacturonase
VGSISRAALFRGAGLSVAALAAPRLGASVPAASPFSTPGAARGIYPVFDIRKFGAKGDGQTDDSAAIQSALDAAAEEHGGVVWVPPGYRHPSASLSRS